MVFIAIYINKDIVFIAIHIGKDKVFIIIHSYVSHSLLSFTSDSAVI